MLYCLIFVIIINVCRKHVISFHNHNNFHAPCQLVETLILFSQNLNKTHFLQIFLTKFKHK